MKAGAVRVLGSPERTQESRCPTKAASEQDIANIPSNGLTYLRFERPDRARRQHARRAHPHAVPARGGRKRIVAPDGSEIAPTNKPRPDGTLVKALARAWRWQRMLDKGVYVSASDIGDAENISKSYVSRILRLALLSPDIIEAILAGRRDQGMMLERLERPLPASWEEQQNFVICRRAR
jgi:hypothetical protein